VRREPIRYSPRWVWDRLATRPLRRTKLTQPHLQRLMADAASDAPCLVVNVEANLDHTRWFPAAEDLAWSRRKNEPGALDELAVALDAVPDGSYPVVLCIGLIEHVPDPQRLLDELHRIVAPGGRAVLSASCAFSIHEGPNDFVHVTPFGLAHLCRDWDGFEVLRGSSQPFETVAILLQRILLQCNILPPVRLLVEVLIGLFLRLDPAIRVQYDNFGDRRPERELDSMLPSNVHAIVRR
jgi:SAM-dependent methyltransferase